MQWAQRWFAELVPSSKYDVILRHKLHTAIFHTNSLSPSLETPDVQCCAQLTKARGCLPQGCAVRGGILPGGQGDQVARAGLEGLKGPFPQWLPGLLSGPREKEGGYGERGGQRDSECHIARGRRELGTMPFTFPVGAGAA